MHAMNDMGIRSKLLLVLALPVVGLLFFSINSAFEKAHESAKMSQIEGLVNVAVKIGAFSHEMQKERGMTGGFLGSKGEKFKNELPEQRKESDQRLATLQEELRDLDRSAYPAEVIQALDKALNAIKDLPGIRESVSRLDISGTRAIGYYTDTIELLLGVGRQAKMLASNESLARLLVSYSNFSFAKERVGVGRALLSNVFTADKFNAESLASFLKNASAQDVYMHEFEVTAYPTQLDMYRQTVVGHDVDEAARMKQIALAGIDGRALGVDANHWFAMVTAKINLFKVVEAKLAQEALESAQHIRAAAQRSLYLFLLLAMVALVATAMLAYYMISNILRQLGGEPAYAADIANKIANGDLTVLVQTRSGDTSSLLAAMKDMSEKLGAIVGDVRRNAESIGSAAKQIAAGNTDLSQRTEEQASSLEETAASMEELTSTVKQNAESARQANQLANGASKVAVKGGEVVGEVVGTMSSINESSRKIVDIISVIDGIAFQTNILALNAAVEAARAGEQGRGFAVVAAEVRNLAQRSAAAAKEIKTLIGDSVDKVEVGTRLVADAGKTMEEIVNAVKRVTDIMSEISAASNEQSTGIEQVNQAITQMDEVTQQNAALVEEAAAAAESMEEQAQGLIEAVGIFKLANATGSTQPGRAAATPAPRSSKITEKQIIGAPVRKPAAKPKVLQAKAAKADGGEWEEF
ncbi:MAG TPA: methyl-accepting chemotaxis protein [Gallionellaceae bacterium]|nr:methyl-accepting chemotaxis protein [Gallionellaceae bacterium]